MAISYRPTGEAQAAAQAGKTIGQGQARQKAAEQSQRMTEIQMAKDWEMQKMLLNSQQDFAHEMRLRQAELDKEARAMEWETEKMEIVSRLDFEQDEKERLRYKAEYKAGRDALNKNKDNMGNAEYAKAEYELNKLYAGKGIPEADSGLGFDTRQDTDDSFTNLPYYYQGATPEKIAELNEAKRQSVIDPESNITSLPWFLSPQYISDPRAREERKTRGIILSNEEVQNISEQYTMKPLDAITAEEIYDESDGDIDKARKIAKERGYRL